MGPLNCPTSQLCTSLVRRLSIPCRPGFTKGNEEQIVDEISGVKAEISNSNAYARYALELLGASSVQNDEVDPQTWALEIGPRADHGIEFTSLVSLNTVYANEHDYVSEYEQYTHHVRRLQSDALNRTGREIIDGEARLRVCVSMGHSVDRCCEYLLWLDGVRMDQEDFAGDAVTTTQSILDKLASQNTTTKPINPFSHSGVRSGFPIARHCSRRRPRILKSSRADLVIIIRTAIGPVNFIPSAQRSRLDVEFFDVNCKMALS